MATVSIILRTDRLNKKTGEAPIHFQIIKFRKVSKIASGFKIDPKYWDKDKSRVKASYPNSERLNNYLFQKLAELNGEVLEQETTKKSLTSKELKSAIMGKEPVNIFDYATKVISKSKGSIDNNDRNSSTMNKLAGYINKRTLYFQEITPSFLSDYETYLQKTYNNRINTIQRDFKFIRTLYYAAYREELISYEVNPFLKFKIKQEKTKREFLTEEELQSIIDLRLKEDSVYELYRKMFVFACYAAGLRVSDLLKLRWKDFDGTHIYVFTKKTREPLGIKLPTLALSILGELKTEARTSEHFIFPVFPDELDLDSPKALDLAISRCTAKYNKALKTIGRRAGVTKRLTTHIARHTFATLALRKAIPVERVSKLLGHAQVRETMIYAKIVNKDLDDAMEAFG